MAQKEIREAIKKAKALRDEERKKEQKLNKGKTKMGSIVFDEKDMYGKDGRKLNPVEQVIFHLLKNSEKKYGLKKESLY